MKVYLDTSVYNRPFDDQRQPRIWLETLAFSVVLQMIEAHEFEAVSSTVVEFENTQNPFPLRKRWVNRCLSLASLRQRIDEASQARAEELEQGGLKALDALHMACAEAAGSEYFLTCDDRLKRRYTGRVKVLNPVEFIRTMEDQPR